MNTLSIILLCTSIGMLFVAIFFAYKWYDSSQTAAMFYCENEDNLADIEALQKANQDFKNAVDQLQATNQRNIAEIQMLRNQAAMRDRYINEIIQPMIFQRKQKFMELDGIAYEMFAIVEMITKYPENINIIPVNLWEQISDELVKQDAFEYLRQMQSYRQTYPTKFTQVPFGECFHKAPLWNLPNQIK